MRMDVAFGVDIGGSGIKCAPVNVTEGVLLAERERIPTMKNPRRTDLAEAVEQVLKKSGWKGEPVGVGFPGVIRNGVIATAGNLGDPRVGWSFNTEMEDRLKTPVRILNDADAAGMAEMKFGAGRKNPDALTLLLTVGTGIGTVLFYRGLLIPNLEMGHIELDGENAEKQVSEKTRKSDNLSWKRWAKRFNDYLRRIEFLLQPDVIILGGGGVKKREKFEEYLQIRSHIEYAHFGNRAGIVGAAVNTLIAS